MKKILFAAVAALAITGCSQNEEFDAASQKAEIGLNPMIKTTTRAGVTNNGNFAEFKVHSYITTGAFEGATALGTAYMDGIEYTKPESGIWDTTDTGVYYWPTEASGKLIQFFAYPNDLITNYALPADDAAGYPSFTYAVAAISGDQKDLVVAHEQDKHAESDGVINGALALNFKHILTKINFAYIPADVNATYTINSIKINDVQGGTAKYIYDKNLGTWDLTGCTIEDYEYPITQAAVMEKTYYRLGDADASLMLFPQDVANKIITINYKVVTAGFEVFNGDKTVTLPTDSKWEVGKNILYTLTLPNDGKKVTVTPGVSDWDSETPNPQTAK